MSRVEKFNLNKNWGVPFEVEGEIEKEIKNNLNAGIWLAITEIANYHEHVQLIGNMIEAIGFSYEECVQLMNDYSYNREFIEPIVNLILNNKSA